MQRNALFWQLSVMASLMLSLTHFNLAGETTMRSLRTLAACLGLVAGVAGTAHANLLSNGSFEGGGEGYSYVTITNNDAGDKTIPGWTVQGSVDWINNYWQAGDGTKSLDLAGLYQHGMVLSDRFSTTVGTTYRVQFDMAGNPDQSYDKLLGAVYTDDADPYNVHHFDFIQTGHDKTNMGWETLSFDFVATKEMSQIAFFDETIGSDPEAWGAALDDVSVDPAPVPEPSTVFLLGAGLAGCCLFGRKRRGKQA
jgi:choice-of-anchor C domain-containing protein